jgi:hypothetical protein
VCVCGEGLEEGEVVALPLLTSQQMFRGKLLANFVIIDSKLM